MLLEKSGRVIGLWSSFAYESGRELTQDNRGVPIDIVDEMLTPRAERARRCIRSKWNSATTPLSSAREFGLTDEWAKKLAQHSPSRARRCLSIGAHGRRLAASRACCSRAISCSRSMARSSRSSAKWSAPSADKKQVQVTVWRGKAEQTLDVDTVALPGTDIDRLVLWAGATLQAPHRAMAAQRGIPPSGVYVGYFSYGSPATRYGLYPGRRIVEVDGVPTPDLDAFLAAVTGRPDRSSVRLQTITWNNAPEVITLKLDKHYWPAYELRALRRRLGAPHARRRCGGEPGQRIGCAGHRTIATEQSDLFGEASIEAAAAIPAAAVDEAIVRLAQARPKGVHYGTSSWSFPGWAGIVYAYGEYAATALARHGLAAYARHPLLNGVGLDRTFYAPVPAAELARYARVVPEDFRFVVKAYSGLTTDPESARGVRMAGQSGVFLDPRFAARDVIAPLVRRPGREAGRAAFPVLAALRELAALTRHSSPRVSANSCRPCRRACPMPSSCATRRFSARRMKKPCARARFPLRERASAHAARRSAAAGERGCTSVIRWLLHAGYDYETAGRHYAPFNRAPGAGRRHPSARCQPNCCRNARWPRSSRHSGQ